MPHKVAPVGFRWVCVTSFRHWRSKKVLYAKDYGKEAFCWLVRVKRA